MRAELLVKHFCSPSGLAGLQMLHDLLSERCILIQAFTLFVLWYPNIALDGGSLLVRNLRRNKVSRLDL